MHSVLGFPPEKRLETILLHFIGFGALININLYRHKQHKSSQKMKNPVKQMLSIIDLGQSTTLNATQIEHQ